MKWPKRIKVWIGLYGFPQLITYDGPLSKGDRYYQLVPLRKRGKKKPGRGK